MQMHKRLSKRQKMKNIDNVWNGMVLPLQSCRSMCLRHVGRTFKRIIFIFSLFWPQHFFSGLSWMLKVKPSIVESSFIISTRKPSNLRKWYMVNNFVQLLRQPLPAAEVVGHDDRVILIEKIWFLKLLHGFKMFHFIPWFQNSFFLFYDHSFPCP